MSEERGEPFWGPLTCRAGRLKRGALRGAQGAGNAMDDMDEVDDMDDGTSSAALRAIEARQGTALSQS